MRAFSIIDASVRADRRKPCATLYYDEERREYRIEIEPWATEDDVPMLLIPFVHKRERVLDGTWSRKWVEERIVPPSRQNIGQVLKANGLTEYDDFRLLLVGMGRCSQDDFELVEIDPERKGAGLPEGGDAPTLAQRMGAELERASRCGPHATRACAPLGHSTGGHQQGRARLGKPNVRPYRDACAQPGRKVGYHGE